MEGKEEEEISLSDKEITHQLFDARNEAKLWKNRCIEMTREKASQLKHIETNLMLLEAKLVRERKEIEKKLSKQNRYINQQKNTIAKLTSANQKLLAGMMLLRYQKQTKLPMNNGPLREENSANTKKQASRKSREREVTSERPNSFQIRGSELIACRARAVENQIKLDKLQRSSSDAKTGHENTNTVKGKAHRSQSLPYVELPEGLIKQFEANGNYGIAVALGDSSNKKDFGEADPTHKRVEIATGESKISTDERSTNRYPHERSRYARRGLMAKSRINGTGGAVNQSHINGDSTDTTTIQRHVNNSSAQETENSSSKGAGIQSYRRRRTQSLTIEKSRDARRELIIKLRSANFSQSFNGEERIQSGSNTKHLMTDESEVTRHKAPTKSKRIGKPHEETNTVHQSDDSMNESYQEVPTMKHKRRQRVRSSSLCYDAPRDPRLELMVKLRHSNFSRSFDSRVRTNSETSAMHSNSSMNDSTPYSAAAPSDIVSISSGRFGQSDNHIKYTGEKAYVTKLKRNPRVRTISGHETNRRRQSLDIRSIGKLQMLPLKEEAASDHITGLRSAEEYLHRLRKHKSRVEKGAENSESSADESSSDDEEEKRKFRARSSRSHSLPHGGCYI